MSIVDKVKYPEIAYLETREEILDNPVDVYEKLDGGNCQMVSSGEQLLLATRSGDHSNRSRAHEWFDRFQNWAHKFYARYIGEIGAPLHELMPERYVFFGEWLSKHFIDYTPEKMDQFYLIDVFDRESKRFMPYDEAVEQATIGGLVPLNTLQPLARGKVKRSTLDFLLKGSDYRNGNKEGLVIKDYAHQQFAKLLNPEYREFVREKQGLDAYLTLRRLEKSALKIRNIGFQPLNQTTLRREFCYDLRKEAQGFMINYKEVDAWLSHNMRRVLHQYARHR